MRKKQPVGTMYEPALDNALNEAQNDILDELTTPHVRLPEKGGGKYKIVSTVPAYTPDYQPCQARGSIVWNKAYAFQAHGPNYLDPIPDPPKSEGH